jgi:hypothetical protein
MKSLRAVITSAAAVSAAVLCLGLASVPAAQAAQAAKPKATPNPCHTYTAKAADALFGAGKHAHLTATLAKGTPGYRLCTVTYRKLRLTIDTSTTFGGFGGPLTCSSRSGLGPDGRVCVSTRKSFPVTLALFKKDGIYFADDFNKILGHKGAALYTFALAQYKAYKG